MMSKHIVLWFYIGYIFLYIAYGYTQETSSDTTSEKLSKSETLLFTTEASITTSTEKIDDSFYKGVTINFPAQAQNRYAAIIRSPTMDSLLRFSAQNKTVFRDIFLGENAGIVFTLANPLTQQATITALFYTSNKKNTPTDLPQSLASAQTIGSYSVSVYTMNNPETITTFPFMREQTLTANTTIIGRVAQEYGVKLMENERIYVFMKSKDFDTLVEFSNRYGRTVASDDWVSETGIFTSLVSVLSPADDVYYITSASFSGTDTGAYSIMAIVTDNEQVLSKNETINSDDTKILQSRIKEYPVSLQKNDVMSVSVQVLSGNVEVIFAEQDRSALYSQRTQTGSVVLLPIFAEQAGNYKIIVATNDSTPVNYTITMYK